MAEVSIFTAVTYGNQPKSLGEKILEAADSYFYLGGRRAHVIPGKEVAVLLSDTTPLWHTALKVVSYLTVILPIIVAVVKCICRMAHKFELVDPKVELEGKVQVTPEVKAQVEALMPVIEKREDHEAIEWIAKKEEVAVFRLVEAPNVVFKVSADENCLQEQFENLVRAKAICIAQGLDLIRIPHTRVMTMQLAEGKTRSVLVAESVEVGTLGEEEEKYRLASARLGKTADQLATFIFRTAFQGFNWHHIPLEGEGVVLNDLEMTPDSPLAKAVGEMLKRSAAAGKESLRALAGAAKGCKDLVNCLFSEEQIEQVLARAVEEGVLTEEQAKNIRAARVRELELYTRYGIWENPGKLLEVDVETLGLDLDAQETGRDPRTYEDVTATMRQVAEETIAEINKGLREAKEGQSVKERRYVFIPLLNTRFGVYHNFGWDGSAALVKEGEEPEWLYRVIRALVKQDHLVRLDLVNGRAYCIQA